MDPEAAIKQRREKAPRELSLNIYSVWLAMDDGNSGYSKRQLVTCVCYLYHVSRPFTWFQGRTHSMWIGQ